MNLKPKQAQPIPPGTPPDPGAPAGDPLVTPDEPPLKEAPVKGRGRPRKEELPENQFRDSSGRIRMRHPVTGNTTIFNAGVPKRPSYIPAAVQRDWTEILKDLMGREDWSKSKMPLVEAAVLARYDFMKASDAEERRKAMKTMIYYYSFLDLTSKRDKPPPRPVGRPPKEKEPEAEPAEPATPNRWV